MKIRINVGLVVKGIIAVAGTVIGFNKIDDAKMTYGDKKKKIINYLIGGANLAVALLSVKSMADTLLLPENDIVPGSMEDLSIEKDFIDKDIDAEE